MSTVIPAVGCNGASAMPTNRKGRAKLILEAASHHGALIVGTEFDDLEHDDIADVLDADLWDWTHSNVAARDGLLVAGRTDRVALGPVRYFAGAPASSVNAERDILRLRVDVDGRWSFTLADLHFPRVDHYDGEIAHAKMLENSREVGADLLFFDANVRRARMRQHYPKRTIRDDGRVQGFAAGQRLVLGGARTFDAIPGQTGDDHPLLKVPVSMRRR